MFHLQGLSFVATTAISTWTKPFRLDRLHLVQRKVLSIREAAELVHADVALGVPPSLALRSCVGNTQSDLYVLAGYQVTAHKA